MSAYYNEIDDYAAQWLRNLIAAGHLPPGDVDSRSILDVQPEDLIGYDQCHFFAGIGIWGYALRRVGWPDDRGIWSGSCPCQPFSAAGRGLGFADERHLWPAWFHLITQRRPARIVGEQVASKDGLEWFDLVSTDLENAAYAVGSADLCAAGFAEQGRDGGGFHLRQRQYFVATLEGLDNPASARRLGAQQDAESNSRDETRLRGPRERSVSDGLGDSRHEQRGARPKPNGPELFAAGGTGRVPSALDNPPSAGLERFGEPRGARTGDERPGGLADCSAASRAGGLEYASNERRREARGGRPDAGQWLAGTSELGELADTAYVERDGAGGRGSGGGSQYSDGGGTVGVADAERGRREVAGVQCGNNGTSQSGGAANLARGDGHAFDGAGRLHGVSGNDARRPNANLVYCRDGRWRPIEPGALPLAYAVPRSMGAMRPELRAVCLAAGFSERDLADARKYRAGALKAFGNALDGETVVAFLEAALPLAP